MSEPIRPASHEDPSGYRCRRCHELYSPKDQRWKAMGGAWLHFCGTMRIPVVQPPEEAAA